MTGKYGFDKITLPPAQPDRRPPRPAAENLTQAIEAGQSLGFVDRSPPADAARPAARRKPGPKRREPQDKLSIPGPKRVIDAFRGYCTARDLTLWEGLEQLLAENGRNG